MTRFRPVLRPTAVRFGSDIMGQARGTKAFEPSFNASDFAPVKVVFEHGDDGFDIPRDAPKLRQRNGSGLPVVGRDLDCSD